MATKEINFTQQGAFFYSDVIQLESESAAIHLEFEKPGNTIYLLQSITGDKFVSIEFGTWIGAGVVFETTLTGGLVGQYIKIQCSSEPTLAKMLE